MASSGASPTAGHDPGAVSAPGRLLAVHVVAVTACVLSGAVLFLRNRDVGLLGWDTYPIIITSRVQSPGDLVAIFTEKLMEGRFPGEFYRPLMNVTFAIDYAIWGLKAVGYQLTNAILWAAAGLALYRLLHRLTGGASALASLAGLAYFLFHPSHAEVVPVPARRADLLCAMFMALSLGSQLSPRALWRRRAPIGPAMWALLAFLSKEAAYVLPLLTVLVVFLCSPGRSVRDRLGRAGSAFVPHGVVLGLLIAVRLAMFGGLGGHRAVSIAEMVIGFPVSLMTVGAQLVSCQWLNPVWSVLNGVLVVLLAGLICTVAVGPTDGAGQDRRHRPIRWWLGGFVVGLVWLVLLGVLYTTGEFIQPWYMLLPVEAAAVLVAATTQWAVETAGQERSRSGLSPRLCLLPLGAVLLSHAWHSPVFRNYGEWRRATLAETEFLRNLADRLKSADAGEVIHVDSMPVLMIPRESGPTVFGAHVLMDYAVQAWAELQYPNRAIRVAWEGKVWPSECRPHETLVILRNSAATH